MLGHRGGSPEGRLGQVAAIWILDAFTLLERTHFRQRVYSGKGQEGNHHWRERVYSAVTCLSYGAGLFWTTRAQVDVVTPLVTLHPSLPLSHFSRNRDLRDRLGRPIPNTTPRHSSPTEPIS